MSITIQVTFDVIEDAILALARLRDVDGASATKPAAAAPKPVKPPKTEPAASVPTAAAPAPAAPATKPESTSATSAADAYTPVGEAIKAAAVANRPAVLAVLADFGAKSGKDLKPEQYADFMTKLALALAPADDIG